MNFIWSMNYEKAYQVLSAYEKEDINFEVFKLESVIQDILIAGTQFVIEKAISTFDPVLNKVISLQKVRGKNEKKKEYP